MNKLLIIACMGLMLWASCKKEDDTAVNETATKSSTTGNPASTDTVEKIIEIKTSFGTLYMWLQKETPLHRENFLTLAANGFFDSTTFHRCVPGFVIQGGDPNTKDTDSTNDGSGGPGYAIPAEINVQKLKHVYGAVGAARDNNPAKASSGSQFYIVLPKNGTPNLNGNYTVFGKILGGMQYADSIVSQPQNANNRPYANQYMDVNVVEKTRQELRTQFMFEAN